MIIMKTSMGDITIALETEEAPETSANFIEYVKAGHYDGTIFHRVINGFMVQGGGFDEKMNQKPTRASIKNEANNGLKNLTGTLAMARTNDPHSATTQFFINVSDNAFLNFTAENSMGWGYAVFARVVEGMDIVNQMKGVKTGNSGGHQDVPVTPIVIESVTIQE